MEAIALHDFNGTTDDELSFKKGSVLKILNYPDGDHWPNAEQNGREGLVPNNYIQMKDHMWYKGRMTRAEAENILLKQPHDGAYLIRESESTVGDFSLSVKFQGSIHHFKVLRDGAGKYFLWVVKSNSLNQLVDYHRTSSVSRTQTIYLKDMTSAIEYRALYDFTAQEAGELAFKKGDIIAVSKNDDDNWWQGSSGGEEGIFPQCYVEKIN